MKKDAMKHYGAWAYGVLSEGVRQRASEYGITEKTVGEPWEGQRHAEEEILRKKLVAAITDRGYGPVMEDAACLWFCRLMALRYMEVNGFLPEGIRVFTPEPETGKRPIFNLDVPYRARLLNLCETLHREGLDLFGKAVPWLELLLPDDLASPEGVAEKLICEVCEEDFKEVETVGWLYQFFLSEKHEAVVDPIHGSVIRKEDIPAATQVFTTDWVVRYLLDNTLGRYWLERHPESRLRDRLTFLALPGDGAMERVRPSPAPEELKVLDPCVGSGHFLTYAFDLLMEIYRECGWSEPEAAMSILEHNLYGVDIDERAAQLARFAVTMKGRRYHSGCAVRDLNLRILAVEDSRGISEEEIRRVAGEDQGFSRQLHSLCVEFQNGGELGSVLSVPKGDYAGLQKQLHEKHGNTARRLLTLAKQAEILSDKYDVVATNPPYMNRYSPCLKDYILRNFRAYKGDLFSVLMVRSFDLCKAQGYCGFMTPMVWMFIKTYEPLRRYLISEKALATLIQFEYSAFSDATVPISAFVLKNAASEGRAVCFRLTAFPGGMDVQKQKVLEALTDPCCGYVFEADQRNFLKLPAAPIAYWLSPTFIAAFGHETLDRLAKPRQGLATGCNDRFVRRWYEVSCEKVCYDARSGAEALATGKKWFPYNKGGEFRKWYGNQDYVVNWEQGGALIRNFRDGQGKLRSRPQNMQYYFRESVSWSLVSSASVAFRYQPRGHIFDVAGMSFFSDRHLKYLLGLCNSKVAEEILAVLAPTINFQAGDIANIPVILEERQLARVEELVCQNIAMAKEDWDSFETSREFRKHPLVPGEDEEESLIARCYDRWEARCHARFRRLKENEEELNRIFIRMYGLQEELSPEVEDKDVTVSRAELRRDIKSLISYAVGCILGRYSHRREGLLYGGGDWPALWKRLRMEGPQRFLPDADNIVPIGDGECFPDDLASKLFCWVAAVYGRETLEANLEFMADALGGGGTPREVLRRYLMTGFYDDHVKTYRNRPVYWLFSSGRRKGFQALIYMHRYEPDLLSRMLEHYVFPQQAYYRSHIEAGDTAPDKAQLKGKAAELDRFAEHLRFLVRTGITIDPDDGVRKNYGKLSPVVRQFRRIGTCLPREPVIK